MSAELSRIEVLLQRRVNQRFLVAQDRSRNALAGLEGAGINAWITGSLVKGKFGIGSDVDFVIEGTYGATFYAFFVGIFIAHSKRNSAAN